MHVAVGSGSRPDGGRRHCRRLAESGWGHFYSRRATAALISARRSAEREERLSRYRTRGGEEGKRGFSRAETIMNPFARRRWKQLAGKTLPARKMIRCGSLSCLAFERKGKKSKMSVVCQKQSVRDRATQSGSARKVERFSVLATVGVAPTVALFCPVKPIKCLTSDKNNHNPIKLQSPKSLTGFLFVCFLFLFSLFYAVARPPLTAHAHLVW